MEKMIFIIIGVIVVIGVSFFVVFKVLFAHIFKMTIHEFDKELTIFVGGGGNSIVLRSENNDQILIIDTKMMDYAKKMKEYIDDMGGNPEITIVNTHFHMDHVTGNENYPESKLITGDYPDEEWRKMTKQKHMPDIKIKPGDDYVMNIGTEVVTIKNMGHAHTSQDLIIYLKNRNILITGDILYQKRHPVLFESHGCDPDHWIDVINVLIKDYPGSVVIPGHGDITDESALVMLKEYFEEIKDAVGAKKKIADLRKKYNYLDGIPFMANFDTTLAYFKKKTNQ
ncbi:MAG: MBL fold metallo-hydrolase [Spirochaetales bacterium]|nr:MBL fold metallo-hydrolase [Spirochaetales bacterium]